MHKAGKEVSEENMKKVLLAAGAKVDESQIKSLITSLKGVDIDKELESASLASVSAPAVSTGSSSASSSSAGDAEPKEEKKEAAAEGLSALFG